MKVGKARAGSEGNRKIDLHFLGQQMSHHVPNGWLFPMLAAFRANVDWNLSKRKFEWKVPPADLVPQIIDDLARNSAGILHVRTLPAAHALTGRKSMIRSFIASNG
jgi:hypothetical protein